MTDTALNKDENLVGSNPRDLALLKIMELQKNPTAVRVEYLYSIYSKGFGELAEKFFGISVYLIKNNFDEETIRGLEELIIQKAKKWSFATQVLMYCTPLFGWIMIPHLKYPSVTDIYFHFSYRFLRSRRRLKKIGVDPASLLIKDWNIVKKK